jgi:serine/threonine-protein kinase
MAVKLVRSNPGQAQVYPETGDVLAGKYRIERVIGEGGMGIVYAAHHELLDQPVAVKLLFAEAGRDKEAVGRFLQEARSAARLQSEHVARVMDIDTLDSGLPFIVMEYLEGQDLSELLDSRGPMAPMLVVDCMLQALEALSIAHAQGIVHRDLKPSNLFLTSRPDGSQIVKILDFGISKTYGSARKVSTLTSSRAVLGSPPYMSPEQVRSPRTVDLRTDIWSLGVVMYELLTGTMPFAGEEVGETFAAILEKVPDPVRKLNPRVPEGLEAVVNKCLARNRDQRYANVFEVATALAPFGSGRNLVSVERIRQTLARQEELSNPKGRAASSGTVPAAKPAAVTGDGPTVDATLPMDARDMVELSPTASTVRRDRFTIFGRPTRGATLLGVAAIVTVFSIFALVFALVYRSKNPPPDVAVKNPPIAEDSPAKAAGAPATPATAVAPPPASAEPTASAAFLSAPIPTATAAAGVEPTAKKTVTAVAKPPPRPAPPPPPATAKPVVPSNAKPNPPPIPTQKVLSNSAD